jgi:RNA polymerase sigma factor (sigma-70 family)
LEVSALRYSGGIGLHGRSPLLKLQSDERLIAFVRRGNQSAFEVLVSRYESRLLSFCRHLLGSREDAEDVLQEVLAAAYNAILADDRPINVRPWLYRIARNRSLNHLRRIRAVGVDSMDVHYSENGASTADKVHEREEFRLLVGDIHSLPETQKTALVLREMDALSYEQIAEAMETTVSSVKSLLVRARVSLAEAAEARLLSCDEVRIELGEIAEGLRKRPSPLVRRHLQACARCESFGGQLKNTNKALAALGPLGPLALLKRFALSHLGHSAGAGSSATAAGSGAAGSTAAIGSTAAVSSTAAVGSAGSVISAGIGAIATKAAAGLAVTALVTAGAVEVSHVTHHQQHVVQPPAIAAIPVHSSAPSQFTEQAPLEPVHKTTLHHAATKAATDTAKVAPKRVLVAAVVAKPLVKPVTTKPDTKTSTTTPSVPGRKQAQTDTTVLAPSPPPATATTAGTDTSSSTPSTPTPQTAPVQPAPPTPTATSTTDPAQPPAATTDPAQPPAATTDPAQPPASATASDTTGATTRTTTTDTSTTTTSSSSTTTTSSTTTSSTTATTTPSTTP